MGVGGNPKNPNVKKTFCDFGKGMGFFSFFLKKFYEHIFCHMNSKIYLRK